MNQKELVNPSTVPTLKFRSKFLRLFETLSESTQKELYSIIEKFVIDQNDVYAADILWKITYNCFLGLSILGLKVKDEIFIKDILVLEEKYRSPHARPLEISPELVTPLKNELRFQRKKFHPDFLIVHYPENCEQPFKKLLDASADPVLTYVACYHCYDISYLSNEQEVERILFLLKSKVKENVFGGIRSLKFSYEQAEYFMKLAPYIANYLESLWQSILPEKEPVLNTPLAAPLEAWRDSHSEALSSEELSFDESSNGEILDESNAQHQAVEQQTATDELPENIDESLQSQLSCLKSALSVDLVAKKPLSVHNILSDRDLFQKLLEKAYDDSFKKSLREFTQVVYALKSKGYDYKETIVDLPRIEAIIGSMSILEGA